MKTVSAHNQYPFKFFVMETNKFADMTREEFEAERGFIKDLDPNFYLNSTYSILA